MTSTPLLAINALKEVLSYSIEINLQAEAADHIHGFNSLGNVASHLEIRPDLQPAKAMLGKLHKSHQWREVYWLEAIAQGAMDLHTQQHVQCDGEGVASCVFCKKPVPFSPWEHLSYHCDYVNGLPSEAIRSSAHLTYLASQGVLTAPSLWLKGVPSWPWRHHPLSVDYEILISSFPQDGERMDVTGCILGGDGSGGPHSRDPRARVCSFGLACIRPIGSNGGFELRWFCNGSVPGNQTVPRAESTAILQALLVTSGDAPYICDNEQVAKTYNQGSGGTANGLLWQAIWQARQRRAAEGHGCLRVQWMPSHMNLAEAGQEGIPPTHWSVNYIADTLATHAAKHFAQIHRDENAKLFESDKLVQEVLNRLIEVAIVISPSSKAGQDPHVSSPKHSKTHYALSLAKDSGHSVDETTGLCVVCGLSIGLNRSLSLPQIKGFLDRPCLGKLGLTFGGIVRHQGNALDSQHLLPLYNIKVHETHSMATQVGLKVHFCMKCGAYGKDMARFLKLPCPSKASIAGKKALASLLKGIMPNRWNPSLSGRPALPGPPGPPGVPSPSPSWPPRPPSLRPPPPPRKVPGMIPFSGEDMPTLVPRWPVCPSDPPACKRPKQAESIIRSKNVCKKGCAQQGWRIDQFCEACHGSGSDQGSDTSSGPLGAQRDCISASSVGHIPSKEKASIPGCIRRNGLCPLVGWTISSYCEYCHK